MCTSPLVLHKRIAGRLVDVSVPCGKCPECLKRLQNGIVVRCLEACKRYGSMCMFTLTYNDEFLPCNEFGEPSLRREDIKLWKKEFRKFLNKSDFAWICIGEYGPKYHRPHYHGCLFGLTESECKLVESYWKKGFTVFKQVPCFLQNDVSSVARYVAKYLVKPNDLKVFSDTVEKPRLMSSLGFGLPEDMESFRRYMLALDLYNYDPFDASTITPAIVDRVVERLNYQFGGFHYSLPLYVLKKLLYEKNLKGNLAPCALRRLVSATLRNRAKIASNQALKKSLVGLTSQVEVDKAVKDFVAMESLNVEFKERSQRNSLYRSYKKSFC